ncbi:MAG: hypothetical protein JHC34_04050 [Acidobacteria bacterium]|jgi:hypothetical protein|nr:hypothetical protein [Acidobacteriota bacterium]
MAASRFAISALIGLMMAALAIAAPCQGSPEPPAQGQPSTGALAWDKDFDLLLEEANVPTRGQALLEKQLASLNHEREMEARRAADLRKRLQDISGNFTLAALAQELGRQGVADEKIARDNLRHQIDEAQKMLAKLDGQIKQTKERLSR